MPKGGFWPRENSESGTEGSLCRTWKMTRDARDTLGESCCGCSASEKAVGSSPTSTRPNCIDTLKQTRTQNPTLFWPRSGVRKAREPTKEQMTANRIIL